MYIGVLQTSVYVFQTTIVTYKWNGFAVTVSVVEEPIVSVSEYRKLMDDYITCDKEIRERVEFLSYYSRAIIKDELQKLCQK